jgi:hypothetical protein
MSKLSHKGHERLLHFSYSRGLCFGFRSHANARAVPREWKDPWRPHEARQSSAVHFPAGSASQRRWVEVGTKVIQPARNLPRSKHQGEGPRGAIRVTEFHSVLLGEQVLPNWGKLADDTPRFGTAPAFTQGRGRPTTSSKGTSVSDKECATMTTKRLGNVDSFMTPIGFGTWASGGSGWGITGEG